MASWQTRKHQIRFQLDPSADSSLSSLMPMSHYAVNNNVIERVVWHRLNWSEERSPPQILIASFDI